MCDFGINDNSMLDNYFICTFEALKNIANDRTALVHKLGAFAEVKCTF